MVALAGRRRDRDRARRWLVLAGTFQLALSATSCSSLTATGSIEMLAFPFVALADRDGGRRAATVARRAQDWARPPTGARARRGGGAAGLAARLAGARRRWRRAAPLWAATEWLVDGRPRLCKWRPAGTLPAISPIEAGAPGGLRMRAGVAAPAVAGVELGGGELAAGTYALGLQLEASGTADVQLTLTAAGDTNVTTVVAARGPPPGRGAPRRRRSAHRANASAAGVGLDQPGRLNQ
jgi:hypothetical protein